MTAESRNAVLRPVKTPAATLSTLGFVGVILVIIAVGLGVVMFVTTSVGAQSKQLAALRAETQVLAYHEASLESEVQRASSANALAFKAAQLGMVPNPYPAFINLADGSITGEPTKVTGKELPMLRGKAVPTPTPTPVIAEPSEPADQGQAPDTVPAPDTTPGPAENNDEPPADMVAAGEAGE
ncbi:MAG TPA: hypothetical protein K8V15_11560 [Tessaracoccus flavescens]|uniref:Cell division protein FtsL n=1 Tax=Tessaracoccus flavescens TaxID=399497 RepID=A0A921ES95_9ACTN|nr:hypothetical protein [Tessaracoccus flavescens]